jgi:hypothetical protein
VIPHRISDSSRSWYAIVRAAGSSTAEELRCADEIAPFFRDHPSEFVILCPLSETDLQSR